MKAPGKGQLGPVTTGWLFALLFFGLLALIVVPGPKPKPEPPPVPYVKPPNRLAAFGLPDNPDLATLPEMFALFAEKAVWIDNKTKFAYWHPGVQRYEYYFEATRVNGLYRFKEVNEPEWNNYYLDESDSGNIPIRFYRENLKSIPPFISKNTDPAALAPIKMPIHVQVDPIKPPAPELKFTPPDSEP